MLVHLSRRKNPPLIPGSKVWRAVATIPSIGFFGVMCGIEEPDGTRDHAVYTSCPFGWDTSADKTRSDLAKAGIEWDGKYEPHQRNQA